MSGAATAQAGAREGGWRPRPDEELLLQAALLPDERALDAFARWRALVEPRGITTLDTASARLLPLLSHNLVRLGRTAGDDPLLDLLRAEHRRAFYDYHLLVRRCRPVFLAFDAAAIPHLVVKGAALAAQHYGDTASRPMEDLDVLVPLDRALDAVRVLGELGWTAGRRVDDLDRELRMLHSLGFSEPGGRGALDLHWRPLYDGFDEEADRRMWARSVPLDLDGVATRAFDATDQLFHACVHGMRWNSVISPVRWVADVVVVLRSSPIDWARLAAEGDARGVTPSLQVALRYVDGRFGAAVPPEAWTHLGDRPTTAYARFAQWARTARPSPVSTAAQAFVVTFADRTRGMTPLQRARAYPGYLRAVFAQDSLGGVVRRVAGAPRRWRDARRQP